jgi:hypothetical protein
LRTIDRFEPLECVRRFLHVSVRLATHEEAGGVFGALLTAAALIARALLRFFALFLARAFTSLTRLRCAAAFCWARSILLLLAIAQVYAATHSGSSSSSAGEVERCLSALRWGLGASLNVTLVRRNRGVSNFLPLSNPPTVTICRFGEVAPGDL